MAMGRLLLLVRGDDNTGAWAVNGWPAEKMDKRSRLSLAPEVFDVREVPDELAELNRLTVADTDMQGSRVIERLAVTLAVAGEEHNDIILAAGDVLNIEVEGATSQRHHAGEKAE